MTAATPEPAAPVQRENVEAIYPLLPAQEVPFAGLFTCEAPAPPRQATWQIEGQVASDRLERAAAALATRHPILRTVFYAAKKQPVQVVLRAAPPAVTAHDLRGLSCEAQAAALSALLEDERGRPFDPRRVPPWRLATVFLTDDEARLVLTHHPILLDAPSLAVLVGDLAAIYDAFGDRDGGPLPAWPGLTPRDYVLWLGGQDREELRGFWRRHLEGLDRATPLAADRIVPARLESGAVVERLVVPTSPGGLHGPDGRPGTGLLAAALWSVLLWRWSGEDEVAFDFVHRALPPELPSPSAAVGPWSTALPLRVKIDRCEPLADLLRALGEQATDFDHHGHLPSAAIRALGALAAARRPDESAVAGLEEPPVAGRSVRLAPLTASGPASEGVAVELAAREDGWHVAIGYRREVLDGVQARRLAASFGRLLEQATADLSTPVGELELLTDSERREVIAAYDRLSTSRAAPGSVYELFIAQAHRRSGEVAAVCGDEQVTYGELAQRAGRIAAWLCARGAGRESRVGLFGERGTGMLAAILATLEAGAAWVPLDPGYPDARLAQILAASGTGWVATQADLAGRFTAIASAAGVRPAVVRWDDPRIAAAGPRPTQRSGGADLANVFFTSGSTGAPKGVMVEQAGMLNHLAAKVELLGLDASSVVAQNASHGFDISVWQFLAPLLAGGRVAIYENAVALDPAALLAGLERDGVSVLETVPSLLDALLDEIERQRRSGRPVPLERLRFVISNAETLPVPLARRWFAGFPRVPLINTYGATECSDDTTHQVETAPPPAEALRVAVGRPIAGFAILVVDERLRPLPPGCPGQIAMGGVGVGRGYLGAPGATAAVFVPNPWAGSAGQRLYLTGDVGRFNGAGDLEFVSRIGNQVKIRGFRVEPEEVAAALVRHPQVQEAAVLALPSASGGRRLVAFTVASALGGEAELRRFLAASLPAYMVPERFVALAALPLNRHGKVDRAKLGRIGVPDAPAAPAGPSGGVAQRIAAVWSEVLGIDRIAEGDSFFDLGGHSLKTLQVRSRLREALGIEVPLRLLFAHPTLGELAQALAPLAARSDATAGAGLARQPDAEHYPLSHGQIRLWLRHRLEPSSPVYNMLSAFAVEGALDPLVLVRSLAALRQRHEGLRSRILVVDGEPRQALDPPSAERLALVDLSGLAEPAQARERTRTLRGELRRPFDLARTPMRVVLVRLAAQRHVLLWTLHHIATDAGSWDILERDLEETYERLRAGGPALPPAPVRYVDYAAWQRSELAGEARSALEEWWLDRLAGATWGDSGLDADRPPSRAPSYAAVGWSLAVPAGVATRLRDLARAQRTTLFTVLLAAAKALLHRLSGRDDVIVGTTVSGRDRRETEGMVGFFVDTLVLRTDLAGDPGFVDLVGRVRATTLAAYEHQAYPFDLLVRRLRPERHGTRNPLVSVLVDFVEAGPPEERERRRFRPLPLAEEVGLGAATTDFDLGLLFVDRAGEVSCQLQCRADLFEPATLRGWGTALGTLLAAAAERPETRLSHLPLLPPAQRPESPAWPTPATPPVAVSLHGLFEAQAARTPEAPAAICGDDVLSYRHLDAAADRLAARLRDVGVGPEVIVGLCLPRSLTLAVAILAVLKAGGGFLPLDPSLPPARLRFQLTDARSPLLLTAAGLEGPFAGTAAGRILLEAGALLLDGEPARRTGEAADPDQLAYVIYTSGSTGRPKGTAIAHRSVVAYLHWCREHYPMGEGSGSPLFATIAFDGNLNAFFLPLVTGDRLVLIPESHGLEAVAAALDDWSLVNLTPAHLDLLEPRLPAADPRRLPRSLILGGDRLLAERLASWRRLAPATRIFNEYGPTEATIGCACYEVLAATPAHGPVPVGRAVPHARLVIVDRHLQPLPAGVAGELAIGGECLARGYLGQAALTAASFVPDPFATDHPGSRLYRTGDRLRRRADGDLEFLGRIDRQVKVRGVRVEPGEVESVLLAGPGVEAAAVTAHDDDAGHTALAAYVVPATVEVEALRRFAAERLPAAMVPAAIVPIAALPLTASGKVDRRALPSPAAGEPTRGGYAPPRDATELALVQLWEEVLGRPAIGVFDDFFALGGHSLQAAAIAHRVAQRFAAEIPLSALFESPTVAALARRVGEVPAVAADGCRVRLAAGDPSLAPLFLVHPHGGEVFGYHALARALTPARQVYGLRSPGLAGETPPASLAAMADRFAAEVRLADERGPYRLAGWSFGGLLAFEVARRLEAEGRRVELLAVLDTAPADGSVTPRTAIAPGELAEAVFGLPAAEFAGIDRAAALALVARRAQHHPLFAGGISPARLERLWTVLEANTLALAGYRTHGRVAADLVLFQATDGSHARDPECWRAHAGGVLRVVPVPGRHHELMSPPAVAALAEALGDVLRRLDAEAAAHEPQGAPC